MQNNLGEIFIPALNYFFKKYKNQGGTQKKLADRVGITQAYMSAVLKGSKTASLELQNQLANILYGPYEEFLAIGRRLKNGLDPEIVIQGDKGDGVEALIAKLSHYVVDHKRIEKDLLESREKYQDIILTSSDMIFETDRDLNFTFLAGEVEEVTGRKIEEIIGESPHDFLDENEKVRIKGLEAAAIRDHSIMDTVVTLKVNNEKRCGQLTAKPVYDDKGDFTGFRGTYKDTTEKEMLKERLDYECWLISEALESITAGIGIVILDKNNRIIRHNSTYIRMFEVPEEIIRENNPRKTFNWVKNKMKDPEGFMQTSTMVLSRPEKFIHEFDLVDGRRIRRVAMPMLRGGELVGRNIVIYDLTSG